MPMPDKPISSRWTPTFLYDWDDPEFMAWRDLLITIIPELDAFFDEVRRDGHSGSCWDLINSLAQVLAFAERIESSQGSLEQHANDVMGLEQHANDVMRGTPDAG